MRPAFVRPLIPADAARPPAGDGWLHEPKWDGYRFQVIKNGAEVRLFSKSGSEYTERLPLMAEAFQRLPARAAVLDGELCFIDAGGQANFRKLHTEMRTRWPDEAQLIFMVYDLLHQDGVDLRPLPLSERKRDLDRLCRKARMPFMRQVETFPERPGAVRALRQVWIRGRRVEAPRPTLRQRPVQRLGENQMRRLETRQQRAFPHVRGPGALTARKQECLARWNRGLP